MQVVLGEDFYVEGTLISVQFEKNFGWIIGRGIILGFAGGNFLRGWAEVKIGRFASVVADIGWRN